MKKIKTGIIGYGNLGRGVQKALTHHQDLKLRGVFTRRKPESLDVLPGAENKVYHVREAEEFTEEIDVMLLCGGSAHDLPQQGPKFANMFNTVDSFDNHENIPDYYQELDKIAREQGNTCAVGIGWDPGLFSLNRMLMEAVLPQGDGYTFWGEGLSQGHSDAIREIAGVKDGVQYTIPKKNYIKKVRQGETPDKSPETRHKRHCYVVLEEGADREKVTDKIKNMPNYFAGYETEINFIEAEELKEKHSNMPHGGFVLRNALTGTSQEHRQVMEFSLDLASNPEFTASVMTAYARAVYRLNQKNITGAKNVFDIPPGYLSSHTSQQLLREYL